MTKPDEDLPAAGRAEPGSAHDPEAAEEYAESVGTDPSPQQVEEYLEIAGAAPLSEPPEGQARTSPDDRD
jgi:hypothetical protein